MARTLEPRPCPTGPAVLDIWWQPLAAALDGGGPALLPVPDGPAADGVLAMGRAGEPIDDDVALVVPTSGSTGEPKGAQLTTAALRHSAAATLERLGGQGQWLLALPVTHIAGQQVLVRSLLANTPPVCLDLSCGFTAEGFAAATETLTAPRRYTALVPTQLARLLDDAPAALTSYDAVLVGGAATPPALLARARDAGVRAVTTYGMSETAGGCVYDGLPLDGVRVRLAGDGRILLGGPTVFRGYRLRPDLTAAALETADGTTWHVTNDIGRLDGGRLEVLGRRDDVIVTGGEKVAPVPVEAALCALAGVRAAAVVGVADREWGQRVVAAVVAADPSRPPTLDAVRAGLIALPRHALPREVVVVAALPLLASGKTDRDAVRRLVTGA